MIWHQLLLAIIFIAAGILHFVKPRFYLKIMPSYIPQPMLMIYLSGVAEIISGILLGFTQFKQYGALLIILQLIVFLLVHINMIINKNASMGLSKPILYMRLLLQFLLIFWAYQYF